MLLLQRGIGIGQPAPRAGQGRADGAEREAGLLRDVGIAESRIPEPEYVAVPLRELVERTAHGLEALAALEVVVGGRGGDGRFGLALGVEQREMLAPAHDRAGLVPGEVGRDGEQPGTRVLRLLAERADER